MSESLAVLISSVGLLLIFAAWVGLVVSAFRVRWIWGVVVLLGPPLGLLYGLMHFARTRQLLLIQTIGLLTFAVPPVYTRLAPIDLGPREKIVEGERHITLTGWDRSDYSLLAGKPDTVVLQMANADVTDATLGYLSGMDRLLELDLNDTQVTDDGLAVLAELPALERLHLANTPITDDGFRKHLAAKESLKLLDLRGTQIKPETIQAWRAAKPGRRAMR